MKENFSDNFPSPLPGPAAILPIPPGRLFFIQSFYNFAGMSEMQILQQPISRNALRALASEYFGDMIKCVADVRTGQLALNAEMHADLERLFLEHGASQENLWGFNLYPDEDGEDFIEYDSVINIRSWQDNPSRDVLNPDVREAIQKVVKHFILD